MEIYGFAMLDMGHDFTQIHPDWYDTLRVTKLPSFTDEFGKDNRSFAGVRQSRLGVKTSTPTSLGELKTIFDGTKGDGWIINTDKSSLPKANVQAVAVFTSTFDHRRIVETCAARGVHVMMEKPLAVNMEHARAIEAAARNIQIVIDIGNVFVNIWEIVPHFFPFKMIKTTKEPGFGYELNCIRTRNGWGKSKCADNIIRPLNSCIQNYPPLIQVIGGAGLCQ
jgi:hypothetical protein